MSRPQVLVDADACPVKAEVLKVSERLGTVVVMVSNGGLRPSRDPMVRHVVVGQGFDAADDWIAENAVADDLVVTADVALAARAVEKGALVLGPSGREFTPQNIGMAMAMRDLGRHLRETGESKGINAPFSPRDRSQFLQSFDRLLRRAIAARAATRM